MSAVRSHVVIASLPALAGQYTLYALLLASSMPAAIAAALAAAAGSAVAAGLQPQHVGTAIGLPSTAVMLTNAAAQGLIVAVLVKLWTPWPAQLVASGVVLLVILALRPQNARIDAERMRVQP